MRATETRWLSADEQRAWRAFLTACRTLFGVLDAQLQRDAGMPLAYYEILVALRMSELAEVSASSKSRISHAVARLEEHGWVRRFTCATDRRGQFAQLTPDGYDALVAAAPGHVEQVRRALIDQLTAEQVAHLGAIGAAISAATAGAERTPCPVADQEPCDGTDDELAPEQTAS